ncbi:MAG TPA: BMC domain-containing protein, partial [Anaerovoracaceae bacterium]|nr:BMC domain-containing protein [Anaerovoracaceae bacterium]
MDVTAIGMVEFNSIVQGIDSTDAMCKVADVTLLVSKTVCPGKYISIVAGDTSAVQQSVHAGEDKAPECVVDSFIIPNIHKSLIPAIAGTAGVDHVKAVGLIECFSAATLMEASDLALKTGEVEPLRLHIAFGIGGKAYVVLSGDVAAVKAAVTEGSNLAAGRGQLVRSIVIPKPHPMLVENLI